MEPGSPLSSAYDQDLSISYGSSAKCFSGVKAHPDVNSTFIASPNSGLGSGELPDETKPFSPRYRSSTRYAQDELYSVLTEIDTYAAWAAKANDPALGHDGNFFDETLNENDAASYDYLNTTRHAVKDEAGFAGKLVVHNPGTVSSYTDLSAISVEFEESCSEWNPDTGHNALKAESANPSKVAVIMYSLPESAMDAVVKQLEGTTDGLFLTSDTRDAGYLNFNSIFVNVVASVDKGKVA